MSILSQRVQQPSLGPQRSTHGVEVAAYDNLGYVVYGHQCPFITCVCGWQTSRGCDCWETVGAEFDVHLDPRED